jgi:hypothetical protein
VPEGDLRQREREISAGTEEAGFTADTIERIIARNAIVTITEIHRDLPWFNRRLKRPDGTFEYHSIAIMDDDSWEYVTPRHRRKPSK